MVIKIKITQKAETSELVPMLSSRLPPIAEARDRGMLHLQVMGDGKWWPQVGSI